MKHAIRTLEADLTTNRESSLLRMTPWFKVPLASASVEVSWYDDGSRTLEYRCTGLKVNRGKPITLLIDNVVADTSTKERSSTLHVIRNSSEHSHMPEPQTGTTVALQAQNETLFTGTFTVNTEY